MPRRSFCTQGSVSRHVKTIDLALTVALGVLIMVGWLLAVATNDAAWAVAAATVVLAFATLLQLRGSEALSKQTAALAEATKELNRIEERRDLRTRLADAIRAAEVFRDMDVNLYVDELEKGQVHQGFADRVLDLAESADLVSDAGTRKALTEWRNWLDAHMGRTDWSIGGQGPQMRKEYIDLKDRFQGEITAWRDRLVSL